MRSLLTTIMRAVVLPGLLAGLAGCAATPDSGKPPPAAHHVTELAIRENPQALILIIKTDPLPAYQTARQTAPAGVLLSFADTDLQIAPKIYYPPDNKIIDWIEARESVTPDATTAQLFVALKAGRSYDLAQDPDGIRIIFAKAGAQAHKGQPVAPSATNSAPAAVPPEKALTGPRPPAAPPEKTSAASRSAARPVTLTWDPVPGASAYRVYWSASPGVTQQRAKKMTVTTNRVAIPGLLPGKTYYFVVTSIKGSLESQPSAELAFTVKR